MNTQINGEEECMESVYSMVVSPSDIAELRAMGEEQFRINCAKVANRLADLAMSIGEPALNFAIQEHRIEEYDRMYKDLQFLKNTHRTWTAVKPDKGQAVIFDTSFGPQFALSLWLKTTEADVVTDVTMFVGLQFGI